jgi:dTDP-D-glucose 4,6-dehydratase
LRYPIDSAKIEWESASRPRISLKEGLRKTLAWPLKQAATPRSNWGRTFSETPHY